jgi:predicted amidohydrolase YtcJ
LNVPFLAPELVERYYPFGDLVRAGAQLSAGSDWPVSSPDPIAAIHVGVNRTREGSTGQPLGEQQQLVLAAAVTAYTWGSAVVNRHEHETGRIAVGYLADLAVLDRNIFDLPAEDIHLARVLRTYSAGSLVYRHVD